MAVVRMRIWVESVEELRCAVSGIIDEIEQGSIGEGCSDYDFDTDHDYDANGDGWEEHEGA